MKKLVIITGLTASGKSGLGLEIAKKYNGEIISCDSVQVYKGLDIGSAKESVENRKLVPHHLIDIVTPDFNYNVGHFLADCKKAVNSCISRNKLPIIVGGTGMYVKALLEGYTLGSSKHDDFRLKWENFAAQNGKVEVWNELKKLDPDLASSVHYNNLNRVIRYLELKTFGEPTKQEPIFSDYNILAVGIDAPKDEIYPKINARVDEMVNLGLIGEVKGLINLGLNITHSSINTIGYREVYQYLTGEISYEKCIELIKQHTRNYAKRQLTFMKTIKGLKIVSKSEAKILIEQFLNCEEKND